MSDRYEFSIKGVPKKTAPFHFTGSGLPSVYLLNGFELEDDEGYGPGVTIERLEELFLAIGFAIASKEAPLTGAEFRFLRKRMDLTQAELASSFLVDEQTIANYEKKDCKRGPADKAIRLLFLAHIARDDDLAQDMRDEAERLMTPKPPVRSRRFSEGWVEQRRAG